MIRKISKSLVLALLLSFISITGNVSFLSVAKAADATPAGPPSWSDSSTVTASLAVTGTDITVSWSGAVNGGSSITGYQATAFSGSDYSTQAAVACSAPSTDSNCVISGLPFATSYKFKVTVTNAIGSATTALSSSAVTTPSQSQTVTITGTPTSYNYGDSDFQLIASATSGLPVDWTSQTPSVCSVDASGTVHFLSVGTCTVRATQSGSGSSYASAYSEATITAGTTLTASIGSATSVQSTQATLNATVPYPGADTTPVFCVSTTNSVSGACSLPSGVSISSYNPSTITASSSSSVSAVASGLSANTTYYFWIKVSASGATDYTTGTSSFTTTTGPSVSYSGATTGTVGTAMSGTLTASSGTGVYASWLGSSLPTGLTFNPGATASTSTVSGTPTAAGTFTALFGVTDSAGLETQLNVSFVISAAPTNNNNSNNNNSNSNSSNNSSAGGSNSGNTSGSGEKAPTPTEPKSPIYKPEALNTNGTAILLTGENLDPFETISINSQLGLNYQALDWSISITARTKVAQAPDGQGNQQVILEQGSTAVVNASGLKPLTQVDLYLLPGSIWLGSGLTDKNGQFSKEFAVLKTLAAGDYTFYAAGHSPSDILRRAYLPVIVLPKQSGTVYTVSTSLIAKTITSPSKTIFVIKDLPTKASMSWESNSGNKSRGISSATIKGKVITIVPTSNFSGVILQTLLIKYRGITYKRNLALTILPGNVVAPRYYLQNGPATKVTWNKVGNAQSYEIFKNAVSICKTSVNSCTINSVIGPNATITVKAIGQDGTESKIAKSSYVAGKPVIVASVNFDNGSSTLTSESIAGLQAFMKMVMAEGFSNVQVIGYTDSTGSSKTNLKLSESRANSVKLFLTGQVVGFVDSIGKGKSKPIKTNSTAQGRAANRRAEILVY
jgi:outer membrane protein OmpA-like peptidoglycan-associated protein